MRSKQNFSSDLAKLSVAERAKRSFPDRRLSDRAVGTRLSRRTSRAARGGTPESGVPQLPGARGDRRVRIASLRAHPAGGAGQVKPGHCTEQPRSKGSPSPRRHGWFPGCEHSYQRRRARWEEETYSVPPTPIPRMFAHIPSRLASPPAVVGGARVWASDIPWDKGGHLWSPGEAVPENKG